MRKLMKTLAFCALLALSAPAYSQHLHIRIAPPRLQIETMPPAVSGEVWQPGFYQFNAVTNSYDWIPGHYAAPPQASMTWVAPHYVERSGEYIFIPGHWR
jgi:hypothetical protein